MNPLDIWEELERTAGGTYGYQVRRLKGTRDVRLAIRYPGPTRTLLVGFPESVCSDPVSIPESEGFTFRPVRLPGEPEIVQLEVALRATQFLDLFGALVSDLITRVQAIRDDREALAVLVTRVQQWQKFLQHVRPEGLTREEQIGLYGELWSMRELVAPAVQVAESVRAWSGPTGGPQDFRFNGVALEVKTTTAREPQSIRITSERQLEGQGLSKLFLLLLTAERQPGSGETLQSIVDEVRHRALSAGCGDLFDELLLASGFVDGQVRDYGEQGYEVLKVRLLDVREGFPRIVASMLPEGVGDVHYSIGAGACQPFSVEQSLLTDSLREDI